jgi:hypothetical protein
MTFCLFKIVTWGNDFSLNILYERVNTYKYQIITLRVCVTWKETWELAMGGKCKNP